MSYRAVAPLMLFMRGTLVLRGRCTRTALRALISFWACFWVGLPQLGQAEAPHNFVRVLRDNASAPLALQTAIVRYETANSPGTHVDLVAAVHVGEPSYYDELNKRFARYDAVLFELIADASKLKGLKPEQESSNPLSMMQLAITNALRLQFQLKGIDYHAANFVHADMSPDQFMQSMRDRNESFMGLLLRAFLAAYKKQQAADRPPDLSSLFLLAFDDARAVALRRLMAQEFEDVDSLLEALNGSEGSTIVTERNKVALETMRKQIALGKKSIAIFYGGAHMPDMSARLENEMKYKPVQTEWLTAWNLSTP